MTTRRTQHADELPTVVTHTANVRTDLAKHKLSTSIVDELQGCHSVIHSTSTGLSTHLFGGLTKPCIQSNRPRQCGNTYRGLTDHTMQGRRL